MPTSSGPPIIKRGLSLCLNATDRNSYPGTGTTWYDLSSNGNNCSLTATWNSGGYFTFDGATQSGTIISNTNSLNFSVEQTLTIVMRHTVTSGRRNPWNQAYGGYGTWTHEAGANINQYFGNAGADGAPYTGYGSQTTATGVWNIMTSVRDQTYHRWILNGNASYGLNSNPYGTLAATTANILIGVGYAGYWVGDMAMILAYKTALTDTEIVQNHEAMKTKFGL